MHNTVKWLVETLKFAKTTQNDNEYSWNDKILVDNAYNTF